MQREWQTVQTWSGTVWSGFELFAQAYLSENLGSLWYFIIFLLTTRHFQSRNVCFGFKTLEENDIKIWCHNVKNTPLHHAQPYNVIKMSLYDAICERWYFIVPKFHSGIHAPIQLKDYGNSSKVHEKYFLHGKIFEFAILLETNPLSLRQFLQIENLLIQSGVAIFSTS